MIYCGPTGHNSKELVSYFQSLDGVPRVQEGINPATWMLEVTRPAEETRLGIDFAQVYAESGLFRQAPFCCCPAFLGPVVSPLHALCVPLHSVAS